MGHILTNSYTEAIFQTTILKCGVSDHFPTSLIISSLKYSSRNKFIYIYKRSIDEQSFINFLEKLFEIDWQEIETLQNPRDAYSIFGTVFSSLKLLKNVLKRITFPNKYSTLKKY